MRTLRVLVLVMLTGVPIVACECRRPEQPVAFGYAVAVFRGTVARIENVPIPKPLPGGVRGDPSEKRERVYFKMLETWKGPHSLTAMVHNYSSVRECDAYPFELSQEYIVYAVTSKAEFGWSDVYPSAAQILATAPALCIVRIKHASALAEERKLLGIGWKPTAGK